MAAAPPPPPMAYSMEEGRRPGVPPNDQVPIFVVCMNVTNTITHLLLGAVAFTAFIIINVSSAAIPLPKLSAHVYLSIFGYVLLMSQAVLSLNPRAGWENNFKYPQKRKLYWILQVLGSALATIGGIMGFVAVADLHNNIPGWVPIQVVQVKHLGTSHGIVGFIAMILSVASLVGGIVHLVFTDLKNNFLLRVLYLCVGTLTLIMAFIAICIAFEDSRLMIGGTNTNLSITITVFALVGMLGMTAANMAVRGSILI